MSELRWIVADGVRLPAKYPVMYVRRSGDRVFVIYDYVAFPRESAARNLFAYDLEGTELWRAEDIGMGATDAYVSFGLSEALIAYNFAGYACRIDEGTGRVLSTAFTK